jgi:hypothetical protein
LAPADRALALRLFDKWHQFFQRRLGIVEAFEHRISFNGFQLGRKTGQSSSRAVHRIKQI